LVVVLREAFSSYLEPLGYELVDLRCSRVHGAMRLDALVDRAEGGITLAECAQINRDIGQLLERRDLLGQPHTLEVSSPGLDRPLVSSSDFRRVVGKRVRAYLREPVEKKIEYDGMVAEVRDDILVLEVETQRVSIPFKALNKAKQVIV
jgi:ribosome maturation factor RimP